MDIHIIIIIIGRERNLSFLPDSQIYLYYFLHLWPFNRTPSIWWCSWRFFAHHKLDIKNVSAIKGKTSQEARGIVVPHWWFQALKVSVFPFLNFLSFYKTTTFCWEFFQRYTHFSKSHKVSKLFQASSLKMRSSHSSYPSSFFQSSYTS